MKRLTPLLLTLLCALTIHAQKVDLSPDSLQTSLCKKWVTSYSLVGGMKLGMQNGAPKMTFEFKKDKTFVITSDQPDATNKKGTWAYDQNKKLVRLTIEGRSNMTVVALTSEELSMAVDTKEATPDDPSQLILVCKVASR